MTELVFSQAPGGKDLVFGEAAFTLPPRTASISVTLGGVRVGAIISLPVRVEAVIVLGSVTVTAAAYYDNRVTPWLDNRAAAPHQPAIPSRATLSSDWGTSLDKLGGTRTGWALGQGARAEPTERYQSSIAKGAAVAEVAQLGVQRDRRSSAVAQVAIAHIRFGRGGWELAGDRRTPFTAIQQTGIAKALPYTTGWQVAQVLRPMGLRALSGASLHIVGRQFVTARHQVAGWPGPGRSAGPVVVTPPDQRVWSSHLVFECPQLAAPYLLFGAQACYSDPVAAALLSILPARFYMTAHNLYAQRLPDLAEVPLYDCTLSADMGSFAWQFSASGPDSLFAQLAPEDGLPQRLRITLDGLDWVFVVESLKRDHQFGKRRVSISGRSVTALVGAPWAREATYNNSGAATAQQLAAQALDLSGMALNWGLIDWLVPANAWSYTGSRLAAVQAIAGAAGGYLQSHRSSAVIQVRHPYPPRPDGSTGGPWAWGLGAADVELAPDAVITSAIERKDGPDTNAIYVSGTSQGVLALVKREGTAGDKLAMLQTDALITHTDAARQRGLATLGKAGPQYAISLELPVLTGIGQPGVIDVGQLVQINDATPWRGRVRSVSVNAAMPKARQTITLERHL